jgi:hypothetical protein
MRFERLAGLQSWEVICCYKWLGLFSVGNRDAVKVLSRRNIRFAIGKSQGKQWGVKGHSGKGDLRQ